MIRKKRGPRKGRGAVLDNLRGSYAGSVTSHPESLASPVHGSTSTPGPSALERPREEPVSIPTSYDASHSVPFAMEDFQSFDEFTQDVLANNSYFSYEPTPNLHDQQSLLSGTPNFPLATPAGSGVYDTPQTTFATIIALDDDQLQRFEVTPVIERSVGLFFEHLYPTYPLLEENAVRAWLQTPNVLSRSEQVLIWSICASTLVMVDNWPDLGWEQRTVSARRFIKRCLQLRLEWDYIEEVDFYCIVGHTYE